jgi:hypothetical protein
VNFGRSLLYRDVSDFCRGDVSLGDSESPPRPPQSPSRSLDLSSSGRSKEREKKEKTTGVLVTKMNSTSNAEVQIRG